MGLAVFAFGKRAEPTAKVTDVRVVDVAVDHVADGIAVHNLAQRLRRLAHRSE